MQLFLWLGEQVVLNFIKAHIMCQHIKYNIFMF